MTKHLFTSESVTAGHPDKVADQISDALVDALLARDPASRAAIETLVTHRGVHVVGQVSTDANVDVEHVVRRCLLDIGYNAASCGLDGSECEVTVDLAPQERAIAAAVARSYEARVHGLTDSLDSQGAGDQGLIFGFACDETPVLMPLPILLAHRLAARLAQAKREGWMPYLGPDGKTQVTVEYEDYRPLNLDTVVISCQNNLGTAHADRLRADLVEHVIGPEFGRLTVGTSSCRLLVNPHGEFTVGGPAADCGLTGRKIIVDTYGGMARHGGGAFSGKDPTKVDRSGAYALRWIAKNVVAAGLARRCEIQVAYAIGTARPVSFFTECFGTATVPLSTIANAIQKTFDLRPAAIIRDLDLRRPIYQATSTYGHFGRELPDFSWERIDKSADLRRLCGMS